MATDPLAVEIGARIRSLRTSRGMTGKALADELALPPTAITAWERGRVIPGGRSLVLLARALGCRVSALLPDEGAGSDELLVRIGRLPAPARIELERFVALLERAERAPRP